MAVIACVDADNVVVASVAWLPLRAALPSGAAPSMNVTVPVGTPAPAGVARTVAVNVTAWPNIEGFAVALRVVVVGIVNGMVTGADTDGAKNGPVLIPS